MVAAVGFGDGRGLAAALALGAQGAATGTRLRASTEMNIAEEWKNRIVAAEAHGTIRLAHSKRFMPPFSRLGGFPRSLRTPFIEEAEEHPRAGTTGRGQSVHATPVANRWFGPRGQRCLAPRLCGFLKRIRGRRKCR
ncbi:nitronate monooxygenase [Streptomyces massasporeus]